FSETERVTEDEKNKIIQNLKKQRYNIFEKDGNILAEKNRFSRWGPYVNHIGLIIILLAAIFRMTPFFFLDDYVWIREGEQKVIPGTNGDYYIENKQFIIEEYDESDERFKEALENMDEPIHKNYQTDVKVFKAKEKDVLGGEVELELILEDSIRMNDPIKFDGYTLYQSGYQLNEFSTITFNLMANDEGSNDSLGEFTVDLMDPEMMYELDNDTRVEITHYYPDYELQDGEPRSVSKFPRNPAFVFTVFGPGAEEGEVSFVGIGRNIDATEENIYKLSFADVDTRDVSGLTVRRDYTLPLFIIGAAIFMIGVVQGMYWQHRRIWINPKEEGILLAAHTNKNWFGLKKDIEKVIANTNVNMVIDQEEEK
ncbi:MAG TPA: cytochrome c biogenesis protein ResB, partial [Pseudogracilibacillus sp.]|nr:cytochrome c biogenesis protein ResB [Pseudogracilibacillus sp.]